jgi:hypothetical protein
MPSQINLQIAERLDEVATLLEQQDASPFRVAAAGRRTTKGARRG